MSEMASNSGGMTCLIKVSWRRCVHACLHAPLIRPIANCDVASAAEFPTGQRPRPSREIKTTCNTLGRILQSAKSPFNVLIFHRYWPVNLNDYRPINISTAERHNSFVNSSPYCYDRCISHRFSRHALVKQIATTWIQSPLNGSWQCASYFTFLQPNI